MENENRNCEYRGGCGKTLAIIAIILSIISIALSAFTLGINTKNNKESAISNTQQNCPMLNDDNCPMQNFMQNGMRNKNNFMPMWSTFDDNRMNNFWRNNKNTASSSNANRKKGGYSPYNKVYDKKPIQEINDDQSPKDYKTFDAPDNTYGEKLKERERQKREKRESMAKKETKENVTKETTDAY